MGNLKFKELINEVNSKMTVPEVKLLINKLTRIETLYNIRIAYDCENKPRSPEKIISYLVEESLWGRIEELSKLDYFNLRKEFVKVKVRKIGFKWVA